MLSVWIDFGLEMRGLKMQVEFWTHAHAIEIDLANFLAML